MNYQELQTRFIKLHLYANDHPSAVFRFVDDTGNSLLATFDTAYETDNGLELDEDGYEEYNAMAFCEESTKKLFEISYHNLPFEVWDGKERVI